MAKRAVLAALTALVSVLPVGLALGAGAYPEASSWSPVGTGAPLETKIRIVWTMEMDTGSVEDAFSLTDGVQVYRGPLVFAWNHTTIEPYASEATPLFALNSSTTYHATVLSTATDVSGVYPLDQDSDGVGGEVTDALAWDFTTEDAIPPTIVGTLPADGAAGVPVTTDVVIEFSEAMDVASTSSAFSMSPGAEGVVLWDPPGTTMTFSPALNLQYGTLYTVTVAATADDLAGNLLDGDGDGTEGDPYAFQFTTEADVTPPRVDAVTPANGAPNASVSTHVIIRFSETMVRASVADAISLTDGVSTWTKANGTLTWSGASFVDDAVAFNLFENLPFAAAITVTVNASIARDPASFYLDGDADGNPEGSPLDDFVWSFTTEATDATPPNVGSIYPVSGALEVPETTDIVFRFSESMNRTTVEDGFALESALRTWTKANGTFTWSQGWDEAKYVPSTNLAFDTSYTIRLAAAPADVNGNPLDGNGDGAGGDPFVSGFVTRAEPDAVPPTVVGTVPVDGATKVTRDPTISITFDDAMDRDATTSAISMDLMADYAPSPVSLGAFEWSAANRTVSFLPSQTLRWDSQYRVSVGQSAKDDAGLQLATPYSFTFRTERWSGRVIGLVVDRGTPVPEAAVALGNLTTLTNETGAFEFVGVEAGTYETTVSKAGYVTLRLTRTLDQSGATGEGGRTFDLGILSLQRAEFLSPVVAASIVAGILAALITVGFLLRRRRRSLVRLEDFERNEGEAER